MIIMHEHQKSVMRHVFGDQADAVIEWANKYLAPPEGVRIETPPRESDNTSQRHPDGPEVPVRIFLWAGGDRLSQVATTTVDDRENYGRQVADALRALADEFDKPAT